MKISYIDRRTGEEQLESPPGEGFLRFLYGNPLGQLTLNTLVKRKFLSDWYGRMMDRSGSVKRIAPFVEQLGIDMSESVKGINEFTSFNDFFYRHLKPEARPIGEGLVSPGDGKLLAFAKVSEVHNFFVKGRRFTLGEFLQDETLTQRYAEGTMVILRLAPNDYHRYHFPYGGTPTTPRLLKGDYLSVSPYAITDHFARVFCENKRSFTALRTEDRGEVLLSPVGATMVGSIVDTYQPDQPVARGDEMGYFAFGGSTVVMLLEPGAFVLDEDLLQNTRQGKETFVQMGMSIGR